MNKKIIKCPICDCPSCDNFVIDLAICNDCSHIFKKIPHKYEVKDFRHLQFHNNPIEEVRRHVEKIEKGVITEFAFPSMMFYTLDLLPNNFYTDNHNQYFNQVSMMILLNRCGLKIIKQTNVWHGKICQTQILVVREENE